MTSVDCSKKNIEKCTKKYQIIADQKKCSYEEEHWENVLSNGKSVIVISTTFFAWGIFTINLTHCEKEDILKKNNILLSDYDAELETLSDGQSISLRIKNSKDYSNEEVFEIKKMLYVSKQESDIIEEDDIEEEFNEDIMEEHSWILNDTIYGFTSGCKLYPIND